MKNYSENLKKALSNSVDNEFSNIPDENEIEWEFSDSFINRTQQILSAHSKSCWRIVNTAAKRIAIVIVVFALFAGGLLSIDSVRAATVQTIKNVVIKTKNILNISDEKKNDVFGNASDGTFKHTEFNYDLPENSQSSTVSQIESEKFDDPKTEIYNKMLNTIDYFDKIEMTIETSMLLEGNTTIEYYCDISAVSAYEVAYQGENIMNESYCDGKTAVSINNADKIYEKSLQGIYRREDAPYIPLKERVFTEADGIPAYRYRQNITNCPLASISFFPQGLIYSYLADFEKWQIKNESAELLGVDCIVIEGTTPPYASKKHNNDNFVMLVDKATGIILKFEAYKNGKVTEYTKTTKYILDKAPVIKAFNADNYKDFTEIIR